MSEGPRFGVRIRDLTGGAEEGIVEEVRGFASPEDAVEFARRYVRDSVERCRAPGLSSRDVVEAWFQFGEDAEILELRPGQPAEVVDAEHGGWSSEGVVAFFAEEPAEAEERDWRALDPRRRPRAEEPGA